MLNVLDIKSQEQLLTVLGIKNQKQLLNVLDIKSQQQLLKSWHITIHMIGYMYCTEGSQNCLVLSLVVTVRRGAEGGGGVEATIVYEVP